MRRERIGNLLLKFSRKQKVFQSEFAPSGETPIVDQSSGTLVVGYTDNPEARHEAPLPVTVFGDHTREVKYVDFPFASGADGTQLLYPNTPDVDPCYFFYAVKNVDLSNYFYALHFKFLKEEQINVSALQVQRRIAYTLKIYDDLIENNRRRMGLLEEAARQLYREWFVRLRFPGHEHTRITNGVPAGWERRRIGDIAECVGGGTPSTAVSTYWEDGDVMWVTPTDVTRNEHLVLLDSEKKITESGLQNSSARLVPSHAVLMTSRASVGFFAVAGRELCTNQGFISIVPHKPFLSRYLLFHLSARVEEIRAMGSGSTYPEVSRGKFREFEVLLPGATLALTFDEQVSQLLNQIRILKQQNQKLRTARDLLLPRLMSGEITV